MTNPARGPLAGGETEATSEGDYRVPHDSAWARAWKVSAGVGGLGVLCAIAGYGVDPRRFAFAYLMGFLTVLTMVLGSTFFVLLQHLTGAGWSVTVRRASEFFVAGAVILPVLALPNLLSLGELYPWWHERMRRLDHPSAFFFLRAAIYLLVWLWMSTRLFRHSTHQDESGDPGLTVQLQRMAPLATLSFAFSLNFAAFDWFMSLEPDWYSTLFGVRLFATSALLSFALNILVTLGFSRAGISKGAIHVEHFHDLGKLLFGFLVFWAYISFSEFFLIWYAAIPGETVYFHRRWDSESWRALSISLVVVKFILPFFLLLSRHAKRNPRLLGLSAAWVVALHLVEMYYWVMPYVQEGGIALSFAGVVTDLGCVLACVGLYLAVVFRRMLNHPVIPVRDPRLQRALQFVNA
ncbi:MAG TPA: hypothetical protein VFS67_36785 [Polyangiaceae bacterium]|nr:hypothetical protein [Polyangiaceae bacterium]